MTIYNKYILLHSDGDGTTFRVATTLTTQAEIDTYKAGLLSGHTITVPREAVEEVVR